MTNPIPSKDSDISKGASETETLQTRTPNHPTRPDIHGNLADQFAHRNSDQQVHDLTDGGDSDFPEPGSNPEHSGEKGQP